MADNVANLLLRFRGDVSDVRKDITSVAADLKALGNENPRVDVEATTGSAERQITELEAILEKVSQNRHIKVDARTEEARVALDELKINLTELTSGKEDLKVGALTSAAGEALHRLSTQVEDLTATRKNIDIKADFAEATTQIGFLQALVNHLEENKTVIQADVDNTAALAKLAETLAVAEALDGKDVKVNVKFDQRGNLVRFTAEAAQAVTALAGDAEEAAQTFFKGGAGLEHFGQSLLGMISELIPGRVQMNLASVAAFSLAIAIGTTLVAAVGALASSLAAAIGGLLALGAALGGALLPVAILAVGVFGALGGVMKALQAQDAARQQHQQKEIQTTAALTSALEQRKQASQQLSDALQAQSEARVQALREEADAAQAVTDRELALQEAKLGISQSKIDLAQAKLELEKFREGLGLTGDSIEKAFNKFTDVSFDPSKLNAALASIVPGGTSEEDQLDLRQKILNVQKARLGEKEATNQVRHATTDLTRAEQDNAKFQSQGISASKGYAAATRAVRDARQALNRANKQADDAGVAASQAKAQVLTKKLSDAQKDLLRIIKIVRKAFKTELAPAVGEVLGAIADGMEHVPTLLKILAPSFKQLGKDLGSAIGVFLREISRPAVLAAFIALARAAGQLAGPTAKIMASLFRIFLNIATAAAPSLIELFKAMADGLAGIADKTDNTKKLGGTIGVLVDNFKLWVSLIGSIIRLFVAFFAATQGPGQVVAGWIKDIADNLTEWLNSKRGREEIQAFFEDTLPLVGEVVTFIGRLVVFFIRLGQIVAPVLAPAFHLFNSILGIVNDLLGLLAHLVRAWARLTAPVRKAEQFIEDKFRGMVGKVLHFFERMIDGAVGWLLKLPRRVPRIVSAIVDVFKDLPGKIGHFFAKIPGFLVDAGGKLVKKAIGIELDVKRAFGHLPEHLYNIGKNLINALIHGMGAAAKFLPNKIKDIAGDVIGGFKHGFGLFSPSRVMIEMGHNISEGLVVGLDESAQRLANAATRSLQVPVLRQITPAVAGSSRSTTVNKGTHIDQLDLHLAAADGTGNVDATDAATKLYEELRRRTGA